MGMTDHAWSLTNGSLNGVLIVSANVLIVLSINEYLTYSSQSVTDGDSWSTYILLGFTLSFLLWSCLICFADILTLHKCIHLQ